MFKNNGNRRAAMRAFAAVMYKRRGLRSNSLLGCWYFLKDLQQEYTKPRQNTANQIKRCLDTHNSPFDKVAFCRTSGCANWGLCLVFVVPASQRQQKAAVRLWHETTSANFKHNTPPAAKTADWLQRLERFQRDTGGFGNGTPNEIYQCIPKAFDRYQKEAY